MYRNLTLLFMATAMTVALLSFGLMSNSAMSKDTGGHEEDVRAIKQAAAAYSAAFDTGDFDRLLSYWSPDAEYIDESGEITQGRKAIAEMLRKSHESLKGYKLKLEGSELRFVTPDVAMVDGKATLISPEGKEVVTPFAAVWVKSSGKWMVRSLRDLEDDTEKEPATPADHLKAFEPLLGDWVSTGKSRQVQLHCGWTLNKSFVLLEYKIKAGGQESLTAQRFGWDPVNQQIRSWYFDSAGGFGEATWSAREDGYVGEAGGVLPDGRIGTATYHVRIGDRSFDFQVRKRAIDGLPLEDYEVHFVRKGAKE
jgi:uncharacterized protein (TIGR02246 family)